MSQDVNTNLAYSERLDHLRFIAALLVLLSHAIPATLRAMDQAPHAIIESCNLTASWLLPVKAIFLDGYLAVGLFITLSGFLFARICDGKEIDYGKFLKNRVLRIYPLYAVVLVLALYLNQDRNGLVSLLTSLLALANLPTAVVHDYLTPHLWTISVEMQFYLLFPFLYKLYRNQKYKSLLMLLGLSLLIKALVFLSLHTVRNFAYLTLFGRIDQFLIGMCLGFLYPAISAKLQKPIMLLLAIAATIGAITWFSIQGGFVQTEFNSLWIIWEAVEAVFWAAVIGTYSACALSLPRGLSSVLAYLGRLSYSLYVTHYFFAFELPPWLFSNYNGLPFVSYLRETGLVGAICVSLFAVFPVVLAVSMLTYHLIEKPFMNMRVRYTKDA